jgi:hypothetical protein
MAAPQLRLERKDEHDEPPIGGVIMITPDLDEDYWAYRVIVGEHQAVIGFPKFNTIGIGFAVEDDWNTNLPYTSGAETIWKHIRRNKGDDSIPDAWCIKAITMIIEAVEDDRAAARLATSVADALESPS